jgi:hypothetical protein
MTMIRRAPEAELPLPSIEPFRVKAVEPIRRTTREQKEAALERSHFNVCIRGLRTIPRRPCWAGFSPVTTARRSLWMRRPNGER